MNISGVGEMGVGETGVGKMGQMIGETGVGEIVVDLGETGTSRIFECSKLIEKGRNWVVLIDELCPSLKSWSFAFKYANTLFKVSLP